MRTKQLAGVMAALSLLGAGCSEPTGPDATVDLVPTERGERMTAPLSLQPNSSSLSSEVFPVKHGKYALSVKRRAGKDAGCLTVGASQPGDTLPYAQVVDGVDCSEHPFTLNVPFDGEFTFSMAKEGDRTMLMIKRIVKPAPVRRPKVADVQCPAWDGKDVSVSVAGVFPEGAVVRDAYSGKEYSVTNGSVTVMPDGAAGGLVLLELASAEVRDARRDVPATVYFAMTDRFANGDTTNDGAYGRKRDGGDEIGTFHGGDFSGLMARLDHVAKLGVDAIMISPVVEQVHGFVGGDDSNFFKHYGYHGYWAIDFTRTDKAFGTEEELKLLVDAAHKRGIRVIVDVAFNHFGYPTLTDMQEFGFGAVNEPIASLERWDDWRPKAGESWDAYKAAVDWESEQWQAWLGPKWVRHTASGYDRPGSDELTVSLFDLPDIKTEMKGHVGLPPLLKAKRDTRAVEREGFAPLDYMIEWHTNWIREMGIDGWRIDAAKHIEPEAWPVIKAAADAAFADWKARNPTPTMVDAPFWIVGEVFGATPGEDRLDGIDAMFNFDYYDTKALEVGHCLALGESVFSKLAAFTDRDFVTFMSSHDTKIHFESHGSLDVQRGSAAGLMLLPGTIQIAYGDESGRLKGPYGTDFSQHARSDMNWRDIDAGDSQDPERVELMRHWQKLGSFRARHPAVAWGAHVKRSDTPYAFSRELDGDSVMVIFAGKREPQMQ